MELKEEQMTENEEGQPGVVFSIEEFAINDGPGIRTTIFLKGCPLQCAWCHNPEGISPRPQYLIKNGKRECCGYDIYAKTLAETVLRNKAIYQLNNGGVTLTGGEPLYQPAFVIDFLERIQTDVHTALETSGYASPEVFRSVTEHIDLIMMDIKHTDEQLHLHYTGVSNKPILRNLEQLCVSGKPFIIRIPLIPGVNDTTENMQATAKLLKGAKHLQRVELLRYNRFAGAKYSMLGRNYHPPFDEHAEPHVYDTFSKQGIQAIVL